MSAAHSLSPSFVKKRCQEDINETIQTGPDEEPSWMAEDREWLKDTNEMLTLNYMVKYSPWKDKDMPGVYFAEPILDHYPPIFDFGVALTMPEIIDFAVRKGIIEKMPPGEQDTRGLQFRIQKYLCQKFGFKTIVEFGMPRIASKKILFSFSVWTNYKCYIPESKKSHVEEVMKQEFEVEELKWFISFMNEGLKSDYTISEDKFLAARI